MALDEKSTRYHPGDEETVLSELGAFGWELEQRNEVYHSQEVFDSAYTIGYGNTSNTWINTTTVTTNYVSAVFRRDPEKIKNYDQVASLGRQYDSLDGVVKGELQLLHNVSLPFRQQHPYGFGILIGGLVLIAFFLIMTLSVMSSGYAWIPAVLGFPAGLAFLIPGIVILVKYKKNNERYVQTAREALLRDRKQQLDLVARARELQK